MWWKTGNHSCWGHCLPLKPLLWHYAENRDGGGWGGGCDHIWDSKQQQQQNFLDELVTHFEMLAVLIFKFTAPYTCSSFACAWTVKGTVNVETKACFFSALQCYNQLKKFTGPKGESYWWFTMLHIVSKLELLQDVERRLDKALW